MRARQRGNGPLTAARQLKEESNFERLQSRREITRSARLAKAVSLRRQAQAVPVPHWVQALPAALMGDSARELPATGGW